MLLPVHLGSVMRPFRKIIYKSKIFKAAAKCPRKGRPSKSSPRSDGAISEDLQKNPISD